VQAWEIKKNQVGLFLSLFPHPFSFAKFQSGGRRIYTTLSRLT
jgi:hypothetical protein